MLSDYSLDEPKQNKHHKPCTCYSYLFGIFCFLCLFLRQVLTLVLDWPQMFTNPTSSTTMRRNAGQHQHTGLSLALLIIPHNFTFPVKEPSQIHLWKLQLQGWRDGLAVTSTSYSSREARHPHGSSQSSFTPSSRASLSSLLAPVGIRQVHAGKALWCVK